MTQKHRFNPEFEPWPKIENWTAEEIKKLCDAKHYHLTKTPGMYTHSHIREFELLYNGLQFHTLSFDALMAALSGLTKTLLLPNQFVIMTQDHLFLWTWCAEIVFSRHSNIFQWEDYEISEHLKTTIHSALANSCSTTEYDAFKPYAELQPHYAQLYSKDSNKTLPFLTFPLLEALLKRACSKFLDKNGIISAPFSVPPSPRAKGPNPKRKKYTLESLPCSNIRDLLYLFYENIADTHLKLIIDELMICITCQDNNKHPFDQIAFWRNNLLHGAESLTLVGGALLSLCFIIILRETQDNFSDKARQIFENIIQSRRGGLRASSNYYPPY